MAVDRLERVNSLVRREIAEAVPGVLAGSGIDVAAITITGVRVASNLRNATVSVSIFGHEDMRGTILNALRERKREFQRLINRDIHLKYTPVLEFVFDGSLAKGDHLLDVLSKMEESGEISPPDQDAAQ